ncbi:MAG: hypothetical protein ACREEW_02740 [Caulobacteraceae bacterium]
MNRRFVLAAAPALALVLAPALALAQDERKKGGGASFIQLETIAATLFRPDGRRGVMTVEVGIDVPDPALHARAVECVPLLQAAYSQTVRAYAAGLPPGAPPDVAYLSLQLQRQTDLTLGRPGARVLLGSVMVD